MEKFGSRHSSHVLLVGGAGYIGVVVADQLLRSGYRVSCLDRLLYDNQACLTTLMLNPNFRFIYGDFCDSSALSSALEDVNSVVILGGLVGDPICKKYPIEAERINQKGIQVVFDGLRQLPLNRIIFISTCSNYGLTNGQILVNEESSLSPLSSYAQAKVNMEREALSLKGKCSAAVTILRFATAFGLAPRMRFDLTLNEFTRALYLGHELEVFDAETWRPYCHVKDFAIAVERVLQAERSAIDFEVFNAGSERNNFTKKMIVDAILPYCPEAKVKYKAQGSDARNYRVDFTKIRNVLNFEPHFSIEDGVREIIVALKSNLFNNVASNKDFYGNYSLPKELP